MYYEEPTYELRILEEPALDGLRSLAYRLVQKSGSDIEREYIDFLNSKLNEYSLDAYLGKMLNITTRLALIDSPDLPMEDEIVVANHGLEFIGIAERPKYRLFRNIQIDGENCTLVALVASFDEPQLIEAKGGVLELPDMNDNQVFRISGVHTPVLAIENCEPFRSAASGPWHLSDKYKFEGEDSGSFGRRFSAPDK